MNPVTVDDVAQRWRPLTQPEVVVAGTKIADAWAVLQIRVPGVSDRLDAGTLDPGLVRLVIAEAVIAVMQNPEGYVEEAIDDWRGRRDKAPAGSRIHFSDDALALLADGSPSPRAFSIAPGW